MKRFLAIVFLTVGCGAQSPQEGYLEDFLRENPEVRFRSSNADDNACWTVDGESDTYISLTPSMTRQEVYDLAWRCTYLGKTKQD